jgi:hypothetical protein
MINPPKTNRFIAIIVFILIFLNACTVKNDVVDDSVLTLDPGLTQVDSAYSDLIKVDIWIDPKSEAESNIIIVYTSLYYEDQNVSREAARISWPDGTKTFGIDECYSQGGYGRAYCFVDMNRYTSNTVIPFKVEFPFLGKTYVRSIEFVNDPQKRNELILYGIK